MLFTDDIRDRGALMLCVGGSHAYGMASASSDVDIRTVFHVPQRFRDNPFVEVESWNPSPRAKGWGPVSAQALKQLQPAEQACLAAQGEFDVQGHPLGKFVRLASQSNPTILEHLFADRYLYVHDAFRPLIENKRVFLSRKHSFQAFTGYARGQMERIETHRKWLLNPPKKAPERSDFGLPKACPLSDEVRDNIAAATTAIMKEWSTEQGFDGILEGTARQMVERRLRQYQTDLRSEFPVLLTLEDIAAKRAGLGEDVRLVLKGEKRFKEARKNWSKYQGWLRSRNPVRAALERRFGFDTKFAAHALRLSRAGLEVVRDGALAVLRPDAEELLAVRNGALSYEDLVSEVEGLYAQTKEALGSSPLPPEPDYDRITSLLLEAYERLDAR